MPTEYNKTHIHGILNKNGKNTTLHNFVLFPWRSHFKNSCIGFHQVSKRSKTIKPLGLWPHGFKCFLAFGNLMKLTLVFEIVHQQQFLFLKKNQNYTKLNALCIASYHPGIIREDRTGVAAAGPQLQSPGYRE